MYRNNEVSGDVAIKIGNVYLWVVWDEGNPLLRIAPSEPASSDAGAVVGP